MLGEKVGSMNLKETSKPIDFGKYGLLAMEIHNVGGRKLLGYVIMSQATFTAEMRIDGSWIGECPNSGTIFCSESVATYKCNGVGKMVAWRLEVVLHLKLHLKRYLNLMVSIICLLTLLMQREMQNGTFTPVNKNIGLEFWS